jgi:hypothetical protein
MRNTYLAVFLLIPACLLAQTPKAHSSGPGKYNLPKVGTMIVNTYYATDSAGALVPRSDADPDLYDDTLIVIRSGFSALGRSNCVAFEAQPFGERPRDTTLYSYAKNGDIYTRVSGRDSEWQVLPFGLKPGKIIKESFPPTQGTTLGKSFFFTNDRQTQVLGYDTASFNGKVYPCIELQRVELKVFEDVLYSNAYTYWFSPDLGYLIRSNYGWDGPYFLNQGLKVFREKN